jgi:hypothetical protein
LTVKLAEVPANLTEVAPEKPEPEITTVVPGGPLPGLKELMVGAGEAVTVKSEELVAVPPGVVTESLPVVAPDVAVAVIWVEELTVNEILAPPNLTAVAPVNPVPVITMLVPIGPLEGVKELIVGVGLGVTVKLLELEPVPSPGTWTEIGPVVAPLGTVAVIWVDELIVKLASLPSKRTRLAPVKPVPVITTVVPIEPEVGLKDVMVGAAAIAAGANSPITSCTAKNRASVAPQRDLVERDPIRTSI